MRGVFLGIGDSLFLEMEDSTNHKIVKFRSRVVEMNDDEIYIDLPINESTGKTGFFYLGTQFKAIANTQDGLFSFSTEIIARKKENIPMLVLSHPDQTNINRSQRRKYVRMPATVDVAVHSLRGSFSPFVTMSIDLSGGGAAISLPSNHPLVEREEIQCWFVLPMHSGEWKYPVVPCEVIRLFKDKNSGKHRASLNFINISENDRMAIIRYCFEKEIQMRNKLVK